MKKYLKSIIAIAAISVMTLSLAACGSNKTTEENNNTTTTEGENTTGGEKETLVVATNAEFPPYEYYEGQDIVGIDVEIMKAIGEKLGMEVTIEDMAFDSIIPAIQSGKADIGAAGMTITEDRLANVDFTDTYCHASQAIIVNAANEEIKTAADLEGKTIGVQLGTTGDMYAGDVTENVERYNKGFEAAMAVAQGKIDAVVIDDQVAKSLAEGNADLKVLEEPFTEEDYAIAVSKDNTELTEKINTALAELKEDGTIQSIIDKYITE